MSSHTTLAAKQTNRLLNGDFKIKLKTLLNFTMNLETFSLMISNQFDPHTILTSRDWQKSLRQGQTV